MLNRAKRAKKKSSRKNLRHIQIQKRTNQNPIVNEQKTSQLMPIISNTNIISNSRKTLLMEAASRGNKELIEHLISKGANVNVINHNGETALTYAIGSNQLEIAQKLLEANANPNIITGEQLRSELIWACFTKRAEIAKLLITHKADLNIQDYNGFTALMWASRFGMEDLVNELINAGADIHLKSNDGETAITNACSFNHINIIKLLFNAGAELNSKTGIQKRTELIWACFREDNETAHLLIDLGAKINEKDCYGFTALMWASRYGLTDIVDHLIKAGADVNLTSNNGETALSNAEFYQRTEIIEQLNHASRKNISNQTKSSHEIINKQLVNPSHSEEKYFDKQETSIQSPFSINRAKLLFEITHFKKQENHVDSSGPNDEFNRLSKLTP